MVRAINNRGECVFLVNIMELNESLPAVELRVKLLEQAASKYAERTSLSNPSQSLAVGFLERRLLATEEPAQYR